MWSGEWGVPPTQLVDGLFPSVKHGQQAVHPQRGGNSELLGEISTHSTHRVNFLTAGYNVPQQGRSFESCQQVYRALSGYQEM